MITLHFIYLSMSIITLTGRRIKKQLRKSNKTNRWVVQRKKQMEQNSKSN